MILNFIFQSVLEILKLLISPFFAVVPALDVVFDNPALATVFGWASQGFSLLGYLAGSHEIILFPLVLNASLLVAEFALSIVWWVIYKFPFLSIGGK